MRRSCWAAGATDNRHPLFASRADRRPGPAIEVRPDVIRHVLLVEAGLSTIRGTGCMCSITQVRQRDQR